MDRIKDAPLMPVPISGSRDLSLFAGLFTIFLCTLFGANTVAIKISISGMGIFSAATIRFAAAALIIALWALFTGKTFRIPKGRFHHIIIITCLFSAQLSLFYIGLNNSNASRGTLLVNLQPFFTLFLAHFFIKGDQFSGRKLCGIAMGFCGVFFVFRETTGINSNFRIGESAIILATFLWACSAVYTKRIIHIFKPFQITFYPMLFSVPVTFTAALLWEHPLSNRLSVDIIAAMLYQILVTSSFGFLAWNTMLMRYGTVSLHSFIFIMPIAGVVFGGLILHEPITLKMIVALFLIVCGILLVHYKPGKHLPSFLFYRG